MASKKASHSIEPSRYSRAHSYNSAFKFLSICFITKKEKAFHILAVIKMANDEENSFVLDSYLIIHRAIKRLLRFSPVSVISEYCYKRKGKDDKRFIDYYVIVTTSISFLVLILWPMIEELSLGIVFFLFGAFRVFEILATQMGALFFDFYSKTKDRLKTSKEPKVGEAYVIQGYLRITILLLHNFAEIVFWFSIFYLFLGYISGGSGVVHSSIDALTFSFYTMSTFGHYSGISIMNDIGYIVPLIQAIIGLFMTLLILSRFIGLLPRAPTSDRIELEMIKEAKKAELLE